MGRMGADRQRFSVLIRIRSLNPAGELLARQETKKRGIAGDASLCVGKEGLEPPTSRM